VGRENLVIDKTAPLCYNYFMIKHWTIEEEQTLKSMKEAGASLYDIAQELNRSEEAIKTRWKRLRAREGKVSHIGWSEEEIALLHEPLSYEELTVKLGRSKRSIQSICEKLGISKRYPGTHNSTGTMTPGLPTILYLVDFGSFKKVGVTQVGIKERLKQDGNYTILDYCELDVDAAIETEKEILKNMRPYLVKGRVRKGFNECFDYPCTQLSDLL
jgi:hypothetical protein